MCDISKSNWENYCHAEGIGYGILNRPSRAGCSNISMRHDNLLRSCCNALNELYSSVLRW